MAEEDWAVPEPIQRKRSKVVILVLTLGPQELGILFLSKSCWLGHRVTMVMLVMIVVVGVVVVMRAHE